MARDKSAHGNKTNGRLKVSGKMSNFRQEEVLLRKGLSTNMNFNKSKHCVKGKEVHVHKK